ncbi:hypothetical protein SBADM41S_05174 [Streptomyces badius]
MSVGGMHNDGLMIGLMLAGFVLALRGKWIAGSALVGLAMMVKSPAAVSLLFIGVLVHAAATGPQWRRWVKGLLAPGLIACAVAGGATLISGTGFGWLDTQGVAANIHTALSVTSDVGLGLGELAHLLLDIDPELVKSAVQTLGLAVALGLILVLGHRASAAPSHPGRPRRRPDLGRRTLPGRARGQHACRARPAAAPADQPTNNLDLASVRQLTSALESYEGALLIACPTAVPGILTRHPMDLLERVDRIAELRSGSVSWYGGGWSAYQEALAVQQEGGRADAARRRRRRTPSSTASAATTGRSPRAPYHSRRPGPARPRVRTPGISNRAGTSHSAAQTGLRANAAGTAESSRPRADRRPVRSRRRSGPASTSQTEALAGATAVTDTGTTSTRSKR